MLRRLVILSLLLAAVLSPSALAASVKVRVEGRTQTIFGSVAARAARPTTRCRRSTSPASAGEFYYALTTSSFGDYVSQVGKYAAGGSAGWVFKVNGVSPPVGADKVVLKDGDIVLWYWATFGAAGGPPTLDLQPAAGQLLPRRLAQRCRHAHPAAPGDAARGREALPRAETVAHASAVTRVSSGRRSRGPCARTRCNDVRRLAALLVALSPRRLRWQPARRPGRPGSGSRAIEARSSCSRPRCLPARP